MILQSEIGSIENSIACLKGQLKLIKNNNAVVAIALNTIATLEEEVNNLKKGMK